MCPDPEKDLFLFKNFNYEPYSSIQLTIEPNYEIETNKSLVNKEISNFVVGRLEARSEIDLTIIDKSPITLRVEFNGWHQLEYGYEVHADSWY